MKSLFCSKMNAASVVICQPVQDDKKKFELCALRDDGDVKTVQLSLAP